MIRTLSLFTVSFLLLVGAHTCSAAQAASPCLVYLSDAKPSGVELHARRDGAVAGVLKYRMEPDGSAYIAGVFVSRVERMTGVSVQLMEHMLAREPDTKDVSGLLVLDNYEATGLKWAPREVTFEECSQIVRLTPFYRSLTRFGFSEVIECRHTKGMGAVFLKLRRA